MGESDLELKVRLTKLLNADVSDKVRAFLFLAVDDMMENDVWRLFSIIEDDFRMDKFINDVKIVYKERFE